jgi:hypothetical protein
MKEKYRIVERIDNRTARIYYAIQFKFLCFWVTEHHYGIWATAEAAEDMVMKLMKNANRVVKTFSYNNMSDATESDKAKIAFTSLFANDDAYWVPLKVSCKLECERDEAKAEIEKLKEELEWQAWTTSPEIAQAKIDELVEQRDRLAGELKEAQDAIEMMLRDSSCRRIPAYTKKQLAAVEGGDGE